MQSLWDWTNVPSLAHRQSVDSGSGTDAFSLTNANPELNETNYLDLNATEIMALSLGSDPPSSENLPPARSAVVDWVQDQSQHDQPSKASTGLHQECVNGTLPHAGRGKQAPTNLNDHTSPQEGCQPVKKVYDIETLLRLKEAQSAVPVMLRVKPEAIAENIFQYMGAATSRRPSTRSRGLSEVSNISTGIAARPKYMTQPFRQPRAPPETSILQRHDGFARFLKQHASPPHHRVTAGGRIVPAGPSSPPPMLDFGSLNGLLRDHPAMATSFQKEGRSAQSNPRVQNPQATSSMTLSDYLKNQSGSVDSLNLQYATQPIPMQTAIPLNNLPFGNQAFMAPAIQTQQSMIPLAMLPDGSTVVSYNGLNYRASWNGVNTIMEPLQPLQLPLDQQYFPQAYLQAHLNSSNYSVDAQPSQASVPLASLVSATNVARPDTSKAEAPPQHKSQCVDELSLKTQLTDLDKHLALYHYDIMPAERASLISQRRWLVEEIDRIRLSKEKSKRSIPIIAPADTGLPVTPAAQPMPGADGLREKAQKGQIPKASSRNKHLSPAAPAFVPRNISTLPFTRLNMPTASQRAKHEECSVRAISGGINTAPRTHSNTNPSRWTSHPDRKVSLPKTRTVSHYEGSSSSSALDPSDPAMRVIDHEDIEYAARYLYNGTKDTKTYCTTVAEFQEAVRRVREQARLYGCAGGQSKDPAYDAEQDLWWAICDRDPIPLPSKVPDHVANSRPWNWNDSAFNYRRQGASSAPGPGYEHARNSPRVFGWDPATTDKMKDVIDVSRSYFALKGQLPSVPFRDFACDRDGNKRLTQSDSSAPTAYGAAPNTTASRDQAPKADSLRVAMRPGCDSSVRRETSSSELEVQHVQHTCSASNVKSQPADKGKARGSDSPPQGIPRTPPHRRSQQPLQASNVRSTTQAAKLHRSAGHSATNFVNTETVHDLQNAYIEEYAETPVAGGIPISSKGSGNPQMDTTPSKICIDTLPTSSGNARNGTPKPTHVWDPAVFPGLGRKLTEAEMDSVWYHTPLDEVTQKYLDDMKAYSPLKNNETDGNNHDVDAAKDHHQNSDSSEPVTESKSSWGPDEGITPTTSSARNPLGSLKKHTSLEEHEIAKTAKVNIPSASTVRAPIPRNNSNDPFSKGFNAHNALDHREVNAVNLPIIESNESHQFLRKMLQSPRYSSIQPVSILSQISSTLAEKINGNKRAQAKQAQQQPENKGNDASNNHDNIGMRGSGLYANSGPSSSASLSRMNINLAVGKAQSSLASSTYQAHGYLPQFDGAGRAHTSSVYREQGIQPLPQVRLPSEASYGDRQHTAETSRHQVHGPSAYTASTTYCNPVNFGYDGGRDSPPPKSTNVPKDQQSTRPAFDYMGVTLADYDNNREDTNNAWHHGRVEDFFQDLREQELRTIASHQRVNTQSAA